MVELYQPKITVEPINVADLRFKSVVNTKLFTEAADHWKKYKCYTKAPEGHKDYFDFWAEEYKRCMQGYKVGDLHITGRNYFYLNYCPIRMVDKQNKKTNEVVATDKPLLLPEFREIDYVWFKSKSIAWNKGKHLVCTKTRRAGWSFKEAADGCYNYTFIPYSKSFYFAADVRYLWGDGIFIKVKDMLDFLLTYARPFGKLREYANKLGSPTGNNPSGLFRASYKNEKGIEAGFMSELHAGVIKDGNQARGTGGRKIVFEEGGSFKGLLNAVEKVRPSVEDGNIFTGQISVFGTGGEEGDYIEGLQTLFENPEAFNFMPFVDIWSEGNGDLDNVGTGIGTCGFFVPCYETTDGFHNDSGIALREKAKAFWDNEREIRKNSSDSKIRKSLDGLIAERPFTPAESFTRVKNFIFQINDLRQQLDFVTNYARLQGLIMKGEMVDITGVVEFVQVPTLESYDNYPIPMDGLPKESCICLLQQPYKDRFGKTPDNMYMIVYDPVEADHSKHSESINSAYLIQLPNTLTNSPFSIVGWYNGRPKGYSEQKQGKQEYMSQLLMLAEYFNAKIGFEYRGGGADLITKARNENKLEFLFSRTLLVNNKAVVKDNPNTVYGFMIPDKISLLYVHQFAAFLDSYAYYDDKKERHIKNYELIYDAGLLRECISWSETKNADRVSAIRLMLPMIEALANELKDSIESNKKDEFFERTLFENTNTNYLHTGGFMQNGMFSSNTPNKQTMGYSDY